MLARDDLSEIDAQSDLKSMSVSKHGALQNNLMSTGNSYKMSNSGYGAKNMLNELSDA